MFVMSERFVCYFFFFKQKTAYEMRISDWSSDVCSSDLAERKSRPPPLALCPIRHMFFRMLERADRRHDVGHQRLFAAAMAEILADRQIGRASCRERVCQYV